MAAMIAREDRMSFLEEIPVLAVGLWIIHWMLLGV